MANENVLQKLNDFFTSVWNWLGKAEKTAEVVIPEVEHKILSIADAIGNGLKVLEGSDLVQFLEKQVFVIIESVDPALKPFFDGLGLELQKIITVTANASADLSGEADKTLEQQAIDGLNAIKNLKGVQGTSYATALAAIVTGISDFGLSNNAVETGVVSPGAATLLVLGQGIHATA